MKLGWKLGLRAGGIDLGPGYLKLWLWRRSPREWIRNTTQEIVKGKAKYANPSFLFFSPPSLLSREGLTISKVLFVFTATTSLRKIVIPGLGNCTRWFYSMTLLQFVSKTKCEPGWEGYLAFVEYNSSGTFGKKIMFIRIYICGKKDNTFASKSCSCMKENGIICSISSN